MTAQVTCNLYDELMTRYEKEVTRRCETSPRFKQHLIDICVGLADNPVGAIAKGRSNDIVLYWKCDVMGKPVAGVCRSLKMPKINIDMRIANGRRIVCTQLIRTDPNWREEYEKVMEQEDWDIER